MTISNLYGKFNVELAKRQLARYQVQWDAGNRSRHLEDLMFDLTVAIELEEVPTEGAAKCLAAKEG